MNVQAKIAGAMMFLVALGFILGCFYMISHPAFHEFLGKALSETWGIG